MVFSSVIFTFLFLPIVLGLYFACRNDRWRNGVLLVSSLFFYWYGEHTFSSSCSRPSWEIICSPC